jgi:REP element-mobilizing transposase RayT
VNSFEYVTTETEQVQLEQGESQTILRPTLPAPDPVAETNLEEESPTTDLKDSEIVELESIPQISYELSYSCLLIPRFGDHYLAGDITEDLPRWMKEICISYGWRLGAIMIRPGYLQWVMSVPLTANPAQFMRITRQLTSQKILEDYPRYKRQNLSGDFWAPGFSVAPGAQFQSMESINSFILQTRRNQGIS